MSGVFPIAEVMLSNVLPGMRFLGSIDRSADSLG
jgi:hypothetical protein